MNGKSIFLIILVSMALVSGCRGGAVEEMFLLYDEAHSINPDDPILLGASHWNQVCWYGSLLGQASDVLEACEMAVGGTADYFDQALYCDSRGLARALTGDSEGAIADFQNFVFYFEYDADYDERVQQRLAWIDKLNQGINPFDEATLEALVDN